MKKLNVKFLTLLMFLAAFQLTGQEKAASPFDFGKMWTFETPPKEWFKEAYGFEPGEEWFEDVRLSSLRFASWCSASFVSPNGLIMTNHHCSREVSVQVQQAGENFDKRGFYANTQADERKVDGLFVEQLVQTVDITDEVLAADGLPFRTEEAKAEKRAAKIKEIEAKYAAMPGWENLRTQVVTYYSGGKYSLYGYKRYDDIRLVWLPELDLGFYGGDPDNFTYPRYNLDCTFWRAYDENGQPLNTSANYLEFNPNGIQDQDPVFVVGNPGRTERYRTVAQLEYDRDYRYKMLLKSLTNRHNMLVEEYDLIKDNPAQEMEAQELLGNIFGLSNSMKAYGGIVGGLHDEALMGRKKEMEANIQKNSGADHWTKLADSYAVLNPHAWPISHLAPRSFRGKILGLMHEVYNFDKLSMDKEASPEDLNAAVASISDQASVLSDKREMKLFAMLLQEISEDIYPGDNTLTTVLDGMNIYQFVDAISKSDFSSADKARGMLMDGKQMNESKDPFLAMAREFGGKYSAASEAFGASAPMRRDLETKIANAAFDLYGTSLPPDATFTLRISDGIVTGYDYNGTVAPYKTTYFGLYDRHYSNDSETPWSLPEKWMNPPMELLMAPLNIVSTNDIIGGNSGSPLINAKGEAVGLIFDGNIESLPGNFIFDEEANRTVSVHAGGIYAALKYIYKADRIVKELDRM